MRLLLVDDEAELAELLHEYFAEAGFELDVTDDGEEAVALALSGRYGLVILDVMMPKMSGIEVLDRIRAQSRVPVLMLTAVSSGSDRIRGLELGADDYVPKPSSPRELVARVRAILRRTQESTAQDPEWVSAGALSLCPSRRIACWEGRPLILTSTEFTVLEVLARNVGRVVSKQDISRIGLGRTLSPFDRSVDMHMSSLRQKLPGGHATIVTVRGRGYQLVKT